MPFVCSSHRAYIYRLGGYDFVAELPSLSMVRWQRIRDDVSTAEAVVPTTECCDVLDDLRTIEHELHIYRNDEAVWQGPITRLEYEADVTRIFAEDVLWQSRRCVVDQGYDQSYPNIGNVIHRMGWLLNLCYGRRGNPWRVNWYPIYGPDDPRTTRIVFAWQMYVWDDLDKYAEDYGADYTVYNRDIYFWDVSLKWLIIPDLDESHLSQLPRIVEYGNQLGTRGIVTNGHGFAGVSPVAPGSLEHYGTMIDWLTTNEIDGQPGLAVDEDGNTVADPEADDIPTSEELASWANTATRSIVERYPSPVAIVIPANTTLLPGAPWEISDMVPGAWFQVTTTRLCRQVTEWQRLQEVVVTEEAPNGETIQFSAVSAPAHPVEYPGVRPDPPGYVPPPEPEPEPEPECTAVLTEPFNNYTTNGWALTSGPSIAAGRTGTCAQTVGSSQRADYTIPAPDQADTVTIGFAWKLSSLPGTVARVVSLWGDGNTVEQMRLSFEPSVNGFILYSGSATGTVLGTSALGLITAGVWYYVEVQITMHDTTGSAAVRLDGTPIIAASAADTKPSTAAVYDTVRLGGLVAGLVAQYDDLYLSTGADCEFQGDPV